MNTLEFIMNVYEQFCVDEAKFHLNKANEILTKEMQDPKKYYDETLKSYKDLARLFPFILAMRYAELHTDVPETEESLSDTQSSTQSSDDNYDPVPQPTHLRF